MVDTTTVSQMAHLGAGIAIGFGAVGAGLGIGFATKGLMDAVSRQPEVAGKAFGFFFCYRTEAVTTCSDSSFVVRLMMMSRLVTIPINDPRSSTTGTKF